jgi:nitrogen regulatory protein P-II 2
VREVKGYSRQKVYLEQYIGSVYSLAFIPKVEITVTIPNDRVTEFETKVMKVASTGRIGDGKIFGVPIVGDVMEI